LFGSKLCISQLLPQLSHARRITRRRRHHSIISDSQYISFCISSTTLAPFDYKEAVRLDWGHSEEGHPHHLGLPLRIYDMPYTSAVFPADLSIMSDRKEPEKLFKSAIQPTSSSAYISFFPLLGTIRLSLDYEFPQNFLASPPEPKNTNHFYVRQLC